MFDWWKKRACAQAEQLVEQNAELSRQISEALAETCHGVTTILDRRHQSRPVSEDRRKVASG